MPKIAPKLQNTTECHSSLIFIQKMVKAAAVIPHDCEGMNGIRNSNSIHLA